MSRNLSTLLTKVIIVNMMNKEKGEGMRRLKRVLCRKGIG